MRKPLLKVQGYIVSSSETVSTKHGNVIKALTLNLTDKTPSLITIYILPSNVVCHTLQEAEKAMYDMKHNIDRVRVFTPSGRRMVPYREGFMGSENVTTSRTVGNNDFDRLA